jgi:putative transposase
MADLGYVISDHTVGNVLRRNGLPPALERKRMTPWSVFIRTHLALPIHGRAADAERLGDSRGILIYYSPYIFNILISSTRLPVLASTSGYTVQ